MTREDGPYTNSLDSAIAYAQDLEERLKDKERELALLKKKKERHLMKNVLSSVGRFFSRNWPSFVFPTIVCGALLWIVMSAYSCEMDHKKAEATALKLCQKEYPNNVIGVSFSIENCRVCMITCLGRTEQHTLNATKEELLK